MMTNRKGRMANYVACSLASASVALGSFWRSQVAKGHYTRTSRFGQLTVALILVAPILQAAPVRVVKETAIPYMSFLSKADFDVRYPGQMLDDPAKLTTGWYVIYEHETLNYYFGPILLESIGEDYLAQLSETVEAAVAARPSIQDYRLELSYEPSASSADSSSTEPPAEPSTPNPLPPQTPPKSSFWGFVKKIFGFG